MYLGHRDGKANVTILIHTLWEVLVEAQEIALENSLLIFNLKLP